MSDDTNTIHVRRPYQERTTGGGPAAPAEGAPGEIFDLPAGPSCAGTPLGPYRLIEELGRGGQGVVYLAHDTILRRRVALKVLSRLAAASEQVKLRFRREAEVASRLDHPGICGILDTGVERGLPYIAMRFVPGRTLGNCLDEALDSGGGRATALDGEAAARSAWTSEEGRQAMARLGPEVAGTVTLIEQAARALHHAHEAGILHRDMKPGNIMVTPEGRPVVLDFGFAREMDQAPGSLTETGEMFGTPAYMSPEQIRGEPAPLDARTDVYSLGVTLYECLTLKRPFTAVTREGLYQAVLTQEPKDPGSLNPEIPRDLRIVLATALEKDRSRRYASARAFADDLRAVLDCRPIEARPASAKTRLLRWARREPVKASLSGSLLVLVPIIAALGGFLLARLPEIRAVEDARRSGMLEGALESGSLELGEGSTAAAEAAFLAALDADPDSPEAIAGLALTLVADRRPDEALELIEEARPRSRDPVVLDRVELEVLAALGRQDDARDLERAIPPPASPLDHYLLGSRELKAGHEGDASAFPRALRHFTAAVLLSPRARGLFHFQRAHAARHAKDRESILESARALKRLWPHSAMAHFWAGFCLRPEDRAASEAAFRRAIDLDPAHDMALAQLAELLLAEGRPDEALDMARRAIAAAPDRPDPWRFVGQALKARGDLDGARAAVETALQVKPGDPESLVALGAIHEARQDRRAAESAFRRAVAAAPRNASAHGHLALFLYQSGRPEDSAAAYGRAIGLAPEDARFRCGLGHALMKAGRLAQARSAFEQALGLDPALARAHFGLGNMDLAEGAAGEAVARYRRALEGDPDYAETHHNLGLALERSGDAEGALAEWRRAAELAPGLAEAHRNLVRVLSRDADHEALRAELERWTVEHPGDPAVFADLAVHLLRSDRDEDLRDRPALLAAARRAVVLSSVPDPARLLLLAQALHLSGLDADARPVLRDLRAALAAAAPADAALEAAVSRLASQLAPE